MTDISILKAQQQEVINQRDKFIADHKSDDEFVALIRQKAHLRLKPAVIVTVTAFIVMVAATCALSILTPDLSPMYMWATVGVPAAVAFSYIIFAAGKAEKYSDIYHSLNKSISADEVTVHDYNKKIDELQKLIDEAQKAEA